MLDHFPQTAAGGVNRWLFLARLPQAKTLTAAEEQCGVLVEEIEQKQGTRCLGDGDFAGTRLARGAHLGMRTGAEELESGGGESRKGMVIVRIGGGSMLDAMNYLERITVEPEKCGGRPCIRGLRIRVKDVLELLAHGADWAEILEDYPDLVAEDIRACLEFAAAREDHATLRAA